MIIKDIFAKDIDRNIRGVIKIGQETETIRKQELEEYVVTKELQKHFQNFFEAYVNSINHRTDATGVWISGFFGSGKSHFLKILSYLLSNPVVCGKRAIDYFHDDSKINDEETLKLIEKAEQVPNDVALFNIDAKASDNAATNKSEILNVFLRVFNETLGYDSDPLVANLEHWLDDRGYYKSFQDAFYKIVGEKWKDVRNTFGFIKNSVEKALVSSGAMDEANAHDYITNMGEFKINPEEFGSMVKEYLDKKGSNHHIVFLVDEVGQFISDNGDKMLNLQTIVEQLQTQCQGRAWVVVTSQQQMNEVTKNFTKQKREDLSKIQGRFNTMINMSSANADEVIQKRLLKKKTSAEDRLDILFKNNKYNINNKIYFSDQISRKKYLSSMDFVKNYPFIPYQFDLLKDVLGAVRKHGAEGKHMSDGERSLLATFQTATQKYEEDQVDRLVPFSAFFAGMYEFLSHDHQIVFNKAESNELVCPNGDHNTLAMQVLDVLFMVKYLDNFPATIENITTLLLDSIYTDREELRAKVKEALNTLLEQKYIQQNVDTYEFLTDKEQDVNEAISNYDVDDAYIINKIGSYLIDDKYISNRFVPKDLGNQYIFNFNVYIDGSVYGRNANSQSLYIITPLNLSDQAQYRLNAQSGNAVILVLPDNNNYISAFRRAGQIEQYIQKTVSKGDNKENAIRYNKIEELSKLKKAASEALRNDLNKATVYVMNDILDDKTDITIRLNKAYQEVIDTSYRYLRYLTSIKSEKDVSQLLKQGHNASELINDNLEAEQAVIEYLMIKTNQGMQVVSMASTREYFNNIPYGYNDEDIAWIVAKAFVDGKIRLAYNNVSVSLNLAAKNAEQVARYLTSKHNVNKVTLQTVREVPEKQKKAAKDFVKDILHSTSILTESKSMEQLALLIVDKTDEKIRELNEYQNAFKQGPGQEILERGVTLLKPIADSKNDSGRTYSLITQRLEDLEDWLSDMEDNGIIDFYDSEVQQKIWLRTQDYIDRYKLAKEFIDIDSPIHRIVLEMKAILGKQNIGLVIPQLKTLNEAFLKEFSELLDRLYSRYTKLSDSYQKVLLQRLADANLPSEESASLKQKIEESFDTRNKIAKHKSDKGSYTELNDQIQLLNNDVNSLQTKIDQTSQFIVKHFKEKQLATKQDLDDSRPQPNLSLGVGNQQIEEKVITDKRAGVKQTKTVKIYDLEKQPWQITCQQDLDNYVELLKNHLQSELDSNDIVYVDFR